jgi:hypothetical protein
MKLKQIKEIKNLNFNICPRKCIHEIRERQFFVTMFKVNDEIVVFFRYKFYRRILNN